jgi:quinol-cytochrome oxidoreductase complex cytochrome b subunit
MKTVIPFLFAMILWYGNESGCFMGIYPPVHMSFKKAEAFISQREQFHGIGGGTHPVIKPDWEITPFYGVEKKTACGAADIST